MKMARTNGSYQKETLVIIVGAFVLFVLLILRNGGNYYMSYLHQDASRAQFEIDQSYVLLISQAEGFLHEPKSENNELYNATLVQEFREKFIEKPTFTDKTTSDLTNAKLGFELRIPSPEDKALDQLFGDQRDGFFVHCCYFDSDSLSKASTLKMTLGWESLIMEADPRRFEALRSQVRAYSIVNAKLSERANFTLNSLNEIIMKKKGASSEVRNVFVDGVLDGHETGPNMTEALDFPLGFVAKTFGRNTVDLLVLKAKGKEFGILKAIVLEGCEVQVIQVRHLGNFAENIKRFLIQNGYKMFERERDLDVNEAIFYTEKVLNKKSEDVLLLLEELQKAKQNKQRSPQYEEQQKAKTVW